MVFPEWPDKKPGCDVVASLCSKQNCVRFLPPHGSLSLFAVWFEFF